MKIVVFDPYPLTNDFLSRMYLGPLRSYGADNGMPIDENSDLDSIIGSVVLMHGDRLSVPSIIKLKSNGNKIVSFDINDSSYFSSQHHNSDESELIDLVFKIAGIPKKNETLDPSIDRYFHITASEVKFLPDEDWKRFERLKPRMRPLPYVLWSPLNEPGHKVREASQRNGRAIVRGGNHFWRVVLWFRLMQEGLDDPNSGFATAPYFTQGMEGRFRYCQSCRNEKAGFGVNRFGVERDIKECTSPASWGIPGEMYGGPQFGRNEFGLWNNRCPASFIWLAEEYERNRGPLNHAVIEKALCDKHVPMDVFAGMLEGASYAADLKWLNTIYTPPRFWEAASCGTVNLVSKRVADQDYFPAINEGEHYITFPDDISSFTLPDEKQWTNISGATKELYEKWIRGTRYPISTNLLEHIASNIKEACL